jgi:putative membrane protein
MRVGLYTACAILGGASGLGAHGQGLHTGSEARVFSAWDQATLAGLMVFAAIYGIGSARLAAIGGRRSRLEAPAFAVGWTSLVAAVSPWFDAASLERFSAHMAQHELMMLVGAPLVMAGRPLSTCLWALPARWRRRIAMPLQHGPLSGAMRLATAPLLAWALHGIAVWMWHVPALYEWAVVSEAAHTLQHGMFVGTSLLLWFGLLYGRYGRAGYGAAVFYVFTTAVHTGVLGALFTFAGTPLYPLYTGVPGQDAGGALADQQVAGLVMWIPAGLVLTMTGLALFAAWLGEAERRAGAERRLDGAVAAIRPPGGAARSPQPP